MAGIINNRPDPLRPARFSWAGLIKRRKKKEKKKKWKEISCERRKGDKAGREGRDPAEVGFSPLWFPPTKINPYLKAGEIGHARSDRMTEE